MFGRLSNALHTAVVLSLLMVPGAVHAQFYLGGGAGQATYKDVDEVERACATVGAVCSVDDSDSAFKVFAGYRFGPYVAFEGGYIDLGEATADAAVPAATAALTAEGGYIAILPQIPLGQVGSIFGRLGLSAVDAKLTASGGGASFRDSSGAGAVVFGAGGEVHLTEQISVRAEWERHSFDEAFEIAGVEIEAPDIDLVSASFVIRF